MSSQAWADFDVTMSPYFLFVGVVERHRSVGGVARSWPQVQSLLRMRSTTSADRRGRHRDVDVSCPYGRRPDARGGGGGAGDLVALRRVDAGQHHPARGAGSQPEMGAHRHDLRDRLGAGGVAIGGTLGWLGAKAGVGDLNVAVRLRAWPSSSVGIVLDLRLGRAASPDGPPAGERGLDGAVSELGVGLGFGLQLGLGVVTIVTTSTVYAMLLAAALADPRPGRADRRHVRVRTGRRGVARWRA